MTPIEAMASGKPVIAPKEGERAVINLIINALDATGQRISGWDNPPLGGDYPTSAWDAGEVIADEYVIPVPAHALPGEYTIAVGMYDADTGERLPVTLANGQQVPERWIILQKVRIEPQ